MKIVINIPKEKYQVIKTAMYARVGEDMAKQLIKYIKNGKPLKQEPSYNSINSLVESNLKNPKAKTFDVLHFVADNARLSTFEAIEKAYNMGVSEQEQVLDKIRADITDCLKALDEIEKSGFNIYLPNEISGRRLTYQQCLGFIDKYKAESEDKG